MKLATFAAHILWIINSSVPDSGFLLSSKGQCPCRTGDSWGKKEGVAGSFACKTEGQVWEFFLLGRNAPHSYGMIIRTTRVWARRLIFVMA